MRHLLTCMIVLSFLISCKKNDQLYSKEHQLKRILFPRDTVGLLCTDCPPIITQSIESYNYDHKQRLISRVLTGITHSDTPVRTDTTSVYSYFYTGNNSSQIASYTQKDKDGIIYHALDYDTDGRLIRDSVTNPRIGNNKVTRFTWLKDTIIQYERQTFIAGTEIKIDTMIISGNNVIKEKITSSFNSFREHQFTVGPYRNPLSYVNNFTLLASDRKNGSKSTLFSVYTPQYITYNFTHITSIKYWFTGSAVTQYTITLTPTIDSRKRVQSYSNGSYLDKKTVFEYYDKQ